MVCKDNGFNSKLVTNLKYLSFFFVIPIVFHGISFADV